MKLKEKNAPIRPAYKRVDIFRTKNDGSEIQPIANDEGFIRLGNKKRSRSKNKSLEAYEKL